MELRGGQAQASEGGVSPERGKGSPWGLSLWLAMGGASSSTLIAEFHEW